MKLPVLISVPHAGLEVPLELEAYNRLSPADIRRDGDEGAGDIYAVADHVQTRVTTTIARAFVDMNRAPDDRGKDGVVKTHTCWNCPVYHRPLPEELVQQLLEKYYRPYHAELTHLAKGVPLGIDCHTMAEFAPPIASVPGQERPLVCLGDANGAFPSFWLNLMRECFQRTFQCDISVNDPFSGGHIIRAHATELPWLQVEISRTTSMNNNRKRAAFLEALKMFCSRI